MSSLAQPRPNGAGLSEFLAQGLRHYQAAQFGDAQACFEKILATDPRHALALWHLGRTLLKLKAHARAIPLLQQAVAARPAAPEPHFSLGLALMAATRPADAVESFRSAVTLKPDWPEAWSHLGHALGAARKFSAAINALQHALTFPRYQAETLNHLGVVHAAAGRPADAVEYFLQAIGQNPKFFQAWSNLGNALRAQNQLGEALVAYRQSLAIEPKNAHVKFNVAIAYLLQGQLSREAWLKYEYRWVTLNYNPHRSFTSALWRGEPLAGKAILLYAEQGLGDTLNFIRYAAEIAARGAVVHVEVQPALKALLQTVPGVTTVIAQGDPLPKFDFHCPLLSVPFAMDTKLETIPASVPYLHAEPDRLAKWRQKIPPTSSLRVGIVWRGNPRHTNDANRSLALEDFRRVFAAEGCEFVSLQVGPTSTESTTLASHRNCTDPTAAISDFSDTAALIAQLDLVLAVDTSVAHLAGALGKPVWLLLPLSPDWRWMLERDDSPWYPGMRLFRQPKLADWSSVIERVTGELQATARATLRLAS